ncbi:MAG: DUF4091 domain-containing protein [Victivallales bacterium]|nr:DUF4091 domain-containing protein [Victivallales bacterium]
MKKTIALCLMALLVATSIAQQGRIIENPVIDEECFKGWKLTGAGGTNPDGSIYVTGTGDDCTYWLSNPIDVKAGEAYMVEFLMKSSHASGGCGVTGPVCCNVDIKLPGPQWQLYKNVFAAPTKEAPCVRMGQWHAKTTIHYANLKVLPVHPIFAKAEGIELGEGEKISINEYSFSHSLDDMGRTFARPLVFNSADFNTNRWVFGKGAKVVYKINVNGRQQLSGKVIATVNYYAGGTLKIQASKDNQNWVDVGSQSAMGTIETSLPPSLYPADVIYLSLSGEASQKTGTKDSDPGAFQINLFTYKASLSGTPTEIKGTTRFVQILDREDDVQVAIENMGDALPGGNNVIVLNVKNNAAQAKSFRPNASLSKATGQPVAFQAAPVTLKVGESQRISIAYDVPDTGNWQIQAALGGDSKYRISTEINVPEFFSINYGEMLAEGDNALWWASSGWKISTKRNLPTVKGKALAISAARNEAEAAQLVITPKKALKGVKVSVSDLKSGLFGGKVIPASAIDVLKVYYHDVKVKTDSTGILGLWPDALPPIKPEGFESPANFNQPVWIRVNVPKDAKAGLYKGTITVSDDAGWRATVPMTVEVFDFTMPDVMSCETAFGFGVGNAATYHKAKTFEQKHKLWEMYMAELSRHHISIYDPGQLARFEVKLAGKNAKWNNCKYLADTPAKGESAIRIEDSFTNRNVSSEYAEKIAIPEGGFLCEFQYKTEQPGDALLTFTCQDAHGNWMSGCNKDFVLKGDGTWQTMKLAIKEFKPGAKTVRVTLRATRWREDGSPVGILNAANFMLKEAATGKMLIAPDTMRPYKLEDLKLEFNWDKWDAYVEEAFAKYHANTLRMPVSGLGSGTFHARHEPTLFGFAENTPEYNRLMPLYFGEIEKHLREKGWLDKCYVYWFDEPDPKDYEFVMNGFRKLKKYAPGLRRMLTEQVEPELIGGPNLWCPGSAHVLRKDVESRHAAGEQFWWYVCTGPKAPYATLFIDHPGTEMRVWLWQTWDFNIDGILIWATNHWTSSCAYPDSLQNPYLDPMSWVSGYDTPKGTKKPWGNGDGRFVYPPEVCADGTAETFVDEPPVGCIRLEMLRDGIEDYEYFAMLKKLLAAKGDKLSASKRAEYEALLKVPADVTTSPINFTGSPAPMEAHRAKLAKAIAQLQ